MRIPSLSLARFWTLGLLVLLGGSLSASDDKKVEVNQGDPAPVFQAVDDQGVAWRSADYVGKKYVVVYFYPGDFTPGCTAQAKSFQANMNKLTEQGIIVIGVSGDSVATHQLFKKAQQLKFTLLADEEGKLAAQFGVPVSKGAEVKTKDADGKPVTLIRKVTAARWTFVIGKDGKIVSKNTKVNPAQDSKQIAELIEKLNRQ